MLLHVSSPRGGSYAIQASSNLPNTLPWISVRPDIRSAGGRHVDGHYRELEQCRELEH